jgi:hypothetical protein
LWPGQREQRLAEEQKGRGVVVLPTLLGLGQVQEQQQEEGRVGVAPRESKAEQLAEQQVGLPAEEQPGKAPSAEEHRSWDQWTSLDLIKISTLTIRSILVQ